MILMCEILTLMTDLFYLSAIDLVYLLAILKMRMSRIIVMMIGRRSKSHSSRYGNRRLYLYFKVHIGFS